MGGFDKANTIIEGTDERDDIGGEVLIGHDLDDVADDETLTRFLGKRSISLHDIVLFVVDLVVGLVASLQYHQHHANKTQGESEIPKKRIKKRKKCFHAPEALKESEEVKG